MVDVNLGEAYGLQMAMEWVREFGLKDMKFKLIDSQVIVDGMRGQLKDVTKFGDIVVHCRDLVSSFCDNFDVEYVKRNVNIIDQKLVIKATI